MFNLLHLFLQDDKGKFNFDESKVINPETGEPVSLFVCVDQFLTLCSVVKTRLKVCVCLLGVQLVSGQRDMGQ